jgi:GT2 family glycosyltransferase
MRIIVKHLHKGENEIPIIIPVADAHSDLVTQCVHNLDVITRLPLAIYLVESNGKEFAYGRSMNAGIKASAPSPFVIGMDSDAFPEAHAIDRLIRYYQHDPRLGFVGIKTFNGPRPADVGFSFQGPFEFAASCFYAGAPFYALKQFINGQWWSRTIVASEQRPGHLCGICTVLFALNRDCYDDIGPFDEQFRLSFMDHDFVLRILTSDKWFLSSCPEAVAYHQLHATRSKNPDPAQERKDTNRFRYLWPRERIRAVRRCAREGKFVCEMNP